MKHSFLLLLLTLALSFCTPPDTVAQISIYTEAGSVYAYENEAEAYVATDFAKVGVNFQKYFGENLHHFETNVAYSFDELDGIYTNVGCYLNAIPVLLDPDRNLRWLLGIGFTYDGYEQATDYYTDTRLAWTYERCQTSFGAKVNLIENLYGDPNPELYIKVSLSIGDTKF